MLSPGFFAAIRSTSRSTVGTGLPVDRDDHVAARGPALALDRHLARRGLQAGLRSAVFRRTVATSTPLETGRWNSRAMLGSSVLPSIPEERMLDLAVLDQLGDDVLTVLIGIAKPMPTLPCSGRRSRSAR